jgi:hypothetical protein
LIFPVNIYFRLDRVPRDRTWRAAKSMIGDVGVFLNTLLTYDKNHIPGKDYS